MKKTKILIADDHSIVRLGLHALLSTENDFEVIGEADDGEIAVQMAICHRPDIVIMDLMMPELDGAKATERIRRMAPEVKILILTTFTYSDMIHQALKSGAAGALLKSSTDADLITAIRSIVRGHAFVSSEVRRLLDKDPPGPTFTERQRTILAQVTQGHTNREIANMLGIREDSVGEHLSAIFSKLGASNRAEAIAIALKKHLLKI